MFRSRTNFKYPHCKGVFGLITLESQNVVRTLPDVFDLGLSLSKDLPFLGRRPVVSTNPLKFANDFVWETYAQVDVRRRNVGSALETLFRRGVLGGGEHQTVGIWSQNRPGNLSFNAAERRRLTRLIYAEWQIIDTALHAYSKVGVSLYDTLGKDAVGEYHLLTSSSGFLKETLTEYM